MVDSAEPYLGISQTLMYKLVDLYFETAYNASLLLHKASFLEALTAGTATPHVVLSICAWAANFYRDKNGLSSLRDHGFMIEWAKRAGTLVFQDVQSLSAENIVTFSILSLFWYTQGSWRLCYLYKGNAVLCLHTGGFASSKVHAATPLELEIRRRRFWACYLMQCSLGEPLVLFEPIANVAKVPLPWPEVDFATGVAKGPTVCLESDMSSGGVYSELVRVSTLWASVLSHVKTPDFDIRESLPVIYALDADLSRWWSQLPLELKLEPSKATALPKDQLSRILLLNLIYHQCLCALHASIVPLFSWTFAEESCFAARRASAQVAFEHACTATALMDAVLDVLPSLNPAHTFIAYTAYSGCAIQIPFLWCSNTAVRRRAAANVRTNVRVISAMALCWKFAALLEIHVRCLYKIHERHAVTSTLDDEPRNADITKLLDFKVNAIHARTSILGFVDILRAQGEGYVKQGEESTDLGIQDIEAQEPPQGVHIASGGTDDATKSGVQQSKQHPPCVASHSGAMPSQGALQDSGLANESFAQHISEHATYDPAAHDLRQYLQNSQTESVSTFMPPDTNYSGHEQQRFDVAHPFFDPAMLELFPDGELPDLSQIGSLPINLYDSGLIDWNMSSIGSSESRLAF